MTIEYLHSCEGVRASQLRGGFFAGWPNAPTPDVHLRVLRGSYRVVLARDGESGPIVGFVTAVSDVVLAAYVPLLEVLPSHRGQGIGRELMRRLLHELRGLYMIDLTCDPELEAFYAPLGMRPYSAMIVRNHARQGGAPQEGGTP